MLRRLIPAAVKNVIKEHMPNRFFGERIFSQEGEDAILMRMFDNVKTGFYVDVGAHHPFRFSNTYAFYKRGWNGIVVDPIPGMAARFSKYRPRDIALEKGVSSSSGWMKYYIFDEGALNTFDESVVNERINSTRWTLNQTIDIECVSLEKILDTHLLSENRNFEFLSVDVEGHDLEVLRSNDWSKYHPKAIVAECLDTTLHDSVKGNPLVSYLKSVGYIPISKTFNSVIFTTVYTD